MRMTLFRLVWPEAMVTEERGTFKSFAKNSMQASLARPSTGGLVRETFNASRNSPVMAFFFARGWTLTAKVIVLSCSWIANIVCRERFVILSEEKNLCTSPASGKLHGSFAARSAPQDDVCVLG